MMISLNIGDILIMVKSQVLIISDKEKIGM